MIDVILNGVRGSNLGVYAVNRPSIPAAKEIIKEINIPGKGVLHIKTGEYEQQSFDIEFNFKEVSKWPPKLRVIKKWIADVNKLELSDDPGMYFKISKAEMSQCDRISDHIGSFTVSFSTDALNYKEEEIFSVGNGLNINNLGIVAHPTIAIKGEGICEISINGRKVKVNVASRTMIDTERMLVYNTADRTKPVNTALQGEYEELYLDAGDNYITCSQGFECYIFVEWRW